MSARLRPHLFAALALSMVAAAGSQHASGQTAGSASPRPAFRQGQSMYIVAFRRSLLPVTDSEGNSTGSYRDYFDLELDVERKVRKKIEEWRFFRVVDKPSEADFVFLINVDGSAMEGLTVPPEAYRAHFKEKFDIDALRDASAGRYMAGPLNIPTLGRLSERMVKQFRESVDAGRARN